MIMGANKGEEGVVKFLGDTQFATGKWLGLALDKPSKRRYATPRCRPGRAPQPAWLA
jgi:hypothetical protein